jgi:hypothetical protein
MPGPGQRVAAHAKGGQDRLGRVSGPLADGGQGAGAGQHRRSSQDEHTHQRVPSAFVVT